MKLNPEGNKPLYTRLRCSICFLTGIIALLTITSCNSNSNTGILPLSDPDNGGLELPEGFQALVVADSIGHGRHIAVNDNGDIYVKLTYNDAMKGEKGTVALRDLNNDGRADSIVYFGDYRDYGSLAVGITIHNEYLYTSTSTQVLRTKLTKGKLIPESKSEVVVTDLDSNAKRNWHTTKPVTFDGEGYMYVPFGAPSNACQDLEIYGPAGVPHGKGLDPCPQLEDHGGIWRFNIDKLNQTQRDGYKFATGLRSIVGMTWEANPSMKGLYAVVNGIDNFNTLYPDKFTPYQGSVLPSELLIKVEEGSDFGWPYAYYDQIKDDYFLEPGYGGDGVRPARVSNLEKPIVAFPGHWAPMDLLFYKGDQFPQRYKNGVFVVFHGSTARAPYPQAGYMICFVPFKEGKPTGKWEIFADGFTGVDTVFNTSDSKYRPNGIAEGPDGSLYIVESNRGKIWRIMYRGDKKQFNEKHLEKMEEIAHTKTYIKEPDEIKDRLDLGSLQAGGIIYNSYCSNCHAKNGKGDNNRYPSLVGSDLVTNDKTRFIEIVYNGLREEIIVQGRTFNGLMPGFGEVMDDQAMASVLTYVRQRFNKNKDGVTPAEVAEIRKHYKK